MKKTFILIFALTLLLCGCGEENYNKVNFDNAETLPMEEVSHFPEFELTFGQKGKYTDNGLFFTVSDKDSSVDTLYFADSTTDEIYPLCAKSNCDHNTDDCPARLDVSDIYYDGAYLYFIEGSASKGKCIMRQRPDGSDRESLFQQEAEKYGAASIRSTLYHGDIVYFATFGSVFNPETGEIISGEHICIGDLKSGETKVVPIDFGQGNGSTIGILGVCGNELIVQRQYGGGGLSGKENYQEHFFLLNLDTYEITLIAEFTLQDRRSFALIGEDLLYFRLNWTDTELLMEHETEGKLYRQTHDVMIVDVKNRTKYLKKNVVQTTESLSDELYIYFEWNSDYTEFTKKVKDLRTGEILPYPHNMPHLISQVRAGKYLYAQIFDENGMLVHVRILEEDFWAGNPNFFVYPEWTYHGITY